MAFTTLYSSFYILVRAAMAFDWGSLGKAIVTGLVGGLTSAWEALKSGVTNIAEGIKDTFKNLLGYSLPVECVRELWTHDGGGVRARPRLGQP